MISEQNKSKIISIAKRYGVKRVLLFGSNASLREQNGRDIDLAVEGLLPKDFFRFYGELLFNLDKPVDLVDLSVKSKFNSLIQKEGLAIYG